MNDNYVAQAKPYLTAIGVHQLSEGVWAFRDVHTASQSYTHHSLQPVALAAYAAVNGTFAAGRFPNWALVDMVDKVPCMDGAELTALSMVCGASIPTFSSASERENIFGQSVWGIVEVYSLKGCFEHVERAYGSEGSHYNLRPRGFDWAGGEDPVLEFLKANAYELSRNVAAATDHGVNDHAFVQPGQRQNVSDWGLSNKNPCRRGNGYPSQKWGGAGFDKASS